MCIHVLIYSTKVDVLEPSGSGSRGSNRIAIHVLISNTVEYAATGVKTSNNSIGSGSAGRRIAPSADGNAFLGIGVRDQGVAHFTITAIIGGLSNSAGTRTTGTNVGTTSDIGTERSSTGSGSGSRSSTGSRSSASAARLWSRGRGAAVIATAIVVGGGEVERIIASATASAGRGTCASSTGAAALAGTSRRSAA